MASKPGLGLLLMGPEKKDEDEPEDDAAVSAASAAIKAMKSGDATALSEALKLHYELCQMPPMSADEEG